jgi:hypothetical protein
MVGARSRSIGPGHSGRVVVAIITVLLGSSLAQAMLPAAARGLSDEVCVVVVTDSALVAGKDTDDHQDHL